MKTETFGRQSFFTLIAAASAFACITLSLAEGQSTVSIGPRSQAKAVAGAPRGTSGKGSNGEESSDKGLNTGIKVHGHWLIEVRNPDGKITARREFENSLVGGSGGGAGLLAGLLGRVITSGGWVVTLDDSSANVTVDIFEPNAPQLSSCTTLVVCSNNLSVSAATSNGTTSNGMLQGTMTLSGSVVWPQNSPTPDAISVVETSNSICLPSTSTASCPSSTSYSTVVSGNFTSRSLDGQNGDPPAVPVSPSQTVQVSVTFSFQ